MTLEELDFDRCPAFYTGDVARERADGWRCGEGAGHETIPHALYSAEGEYRIFTTADEWYVPKHREVG